LHYRNSLILVAVAAVLAGCAPRGEALLERADASLAKGDYRAAMIDLKNYVASNPEDAGARAKLAVALLETGDLAEAEAEATKARTLGADRKLTVVPDCRLFIAKDAYQRVLDECADVGDPAVDAELAIARGDALIGLQRYEEARRTFEAAVRARPDHLGALQGLAAASFGLQGLEGARAVFDAAPAGLKEQPRYWLARGSLEIRGGDNAAAEQSFRTAVSKTSGEADSREHLSALGGLAEAELRQGKTVEAAATSEELLKAAPRSSFAKVLRAQTAASAGEYATARTLLEETVSSDPENVQARTLLGVVNLEQGNLGQAEMHLANVVARDPDNVRAQQLLASVRSQLQSPEASLDALKPALDRPAADPSLYALASQLSLQSGNREAAIGYLDQAAEAAGPSTPEARLQLASGYLAAGQVERAIEILESMPQTEGVTSAQRETLLVAALLQQGKTDEALARADRLAGRPASDVDAHVLAGAVYASAGRRDRARAEWTRALEERPDDASVRLNLARLDIADGKPEAAAAQLNAVLEKDPRNLTATLGMAAVAQAQSDLPAAERWIRKAVEDNPGSADVRLAQAQFYLAQRNFGEARAAAVEAGKLSPRSAAAANALGLAALGTGDIAAAIASFRQAVEFAPSGRYHLNLARAYAVDRNTGAALAVLDDALRVSPGQPSTLALATTIALQAGHVEKAAGYVARLRAAAPEVASTDRLEGDVAYAQKRYKDALSFYDRAARGGSDAALVAAKYRAGAAAKIAEPQRPLEDWLARNPDDPGVLVLLGDYQQQRGDVAAATASYEKALKAAPGNVVALNNLAGIYQQKGDARALDLARRAHEAAPRNPAVQDTYGWALVESGEVAKGLELIREAARALPDVPEVQYHLAAALARKGDAVEARRLLKQVLAAGDVPASVKTGAQAELDRLGD